MNKPLPLVPFVYNLSYLPLPSTLPNLPGLSDCHNARVARERQNHERHEQRKRELAEALENAEHDWRQCHSLFRDGDSHAETRLAAVLQRHRPTTSRWFWLVVCSECEKYGDEVTWPCGTFQDIQNK
ncbi:MAG: hypothetical protein ACREQ5_00590 [Candidatus Dormibacteria bacterium]